VAAEACILCGAKPPPPLTGEHIWPDWYNHQQPSFRYELESVINDETSIRQTQALNLKPRVLCKPCNNDWGSKLEDRVAPILTPMLQGEARAITPADARLISAWFFLKVMVSEYLLPTGSRPRQFFGLEHGEHLKATLQPPEGVRIWIGQYVDGRAGWITDRSSTRRVSDDPPAAIYWHSATYSIGQVVLHLFAASLPIRLVPLGNPKEPRRINYRMDWAPGNWSTGLIRIWEPTSGPVSWPPEKAFDDKHFVYLADRWNVQEPPSAETTPEIASTESGST
jgi:hypothetical protein